MTLFLADSNRLPAIGRPPAWAFFLLDFKCPQPERLTTNIAPSIIPICRVLTVSRSGQLPAVAFPFACLAESNYDGYTKEEIMLLTRRDRGDYFQVRLLMNFFSLPIHVYVPHLRD